MSKKTLNATRAKRKREIFNGHGANHERLQALLVKMENVHFACIAFASQYKQLQRMLKKVKVEEVVAADPEADTLDESAAAVLT